MRGPWRGAAALSGRFRGGLREHFLQKVACAKGTRARSHVFHVLFACREEGLADSVQPERSVAVFLATPAGLHRLRQPRNTFGRLQKCGEPAVRCPVSDDTFLCGAFFPRMSWWIGACVGVVARKSELRTAGAGGNQCRGRGGSIHDGGVACR